MSIKKNNTLHLLMQKGTTCDNFSPLIEKTGKIQFNRKSSLFFALNFSAISIPLLTFCKFLLIPITENNYPKEAEIPGLTPGLAHAVMFFTNIHLRPVSDTTILVG